MYNYILTNESTIKWKEIDFSSQKIEVASFAMFDKVYVKNRKPWSPIDL
jgi:hypothetical protein